MGPKPIKRGLATGSSVGRSPAGRGAFAVRAILGILLALVAAVSLVRGSGLTAGRDLGSARGERLWHSFAASHGELAESLAAMRSHLVPGEAIYLVVPPGRYQDRWLRTMVRYHWPEQRLAGFYERGGDPPPAAATRVAISWNGRLWLTRGGIERASFGGVEEAGSSR